MLAKELKAIHIRTDDIRIGLKAQEKSYGAAPRIATALCDEALSKGKSVIQDFDAVLPRRQKELLRAAKKHGARFFLIRIQTPERLILSRLRKKRYTKRDLFTNANEAIRVYFIRKRLHKRTPKAVPDFIINNGKLLLPQIQRAVKKIKEDVSRKTR
jgi:predicted kinase